MYLNVLKMVFAYLIFCSLTNEFVSSAFHIHSRKGNKIMLFSYKRGHGTKKRERQLVSKVGFSF